MKVQEFMYFLNQQGVKSIFKHGNNLVGQVLIISVSNGVMQRWEHDDIYIYICVSVHYDCDRKSTQIK